MYRALGKKATKKSENSYTGSFSSIALLGASLGHEVLVLVPCAPLLTGLLTPRAVM